MKHPAWRQSLTDRPRPHLLTVLLLLGMLSLPVECTMVAGPHSMFINAASLAALQHETRPAAAQQHASAQTGHDHAEETGPPRPLDDDAPPLPSPAELAGNSLTAIDMPTFSPPVTASSVALVGDYVAYVLVERPAQEPDRPPPKASPGYLRT